MSTDGKPIPQLTEADERRFWSKVALPDPETGCMEWLAGKNRDGYGAFWLGGSMYLTHRISYTLANGEIPPGRVLDHICRNRACVAPDHLEVVDNQTNILRGESFSAENAKRIRCSQGHEFSAENTYMRPNGGRQCRTCKRERMRAYRLREKLARAA